MFYPKSRNAIFVGNVEELGSLEEIKLLKGKRNVDSAKNPKDGSEYHMDENHLEENLQGQEILNQMKWRMIQILRIVGGRKSLHHHQYLKTTLHS